MAKSKAYLDIPAYRMARIIRENDFSISPPQIAVVYQPLFGRQVLEIRAPFRRRWSFLSKKLQKRHGPRNNRMTIPVSYLVLRWKPINGDSPHWALVEEAKIDMTKRFEKGLFYDDQAKTWNLLCYQVVEDMSHLRRLFIHIFAQYQRELRDTDGLQTRIEKALLDEFVLGKSIPPHVRVLMDQFQRYVGKRMHELGNIGTVLEGRNFMVNFYAQRIEGLLYAVARTLDTACDNMIRITDTNMPNLQTRLRPEVAKLDSIVSGNIRRSRRSAQRDMTIGIELLTHDRAAAFRRLRLASTKLKEAAKTMENWAATISEAEMAEARRYQGLAS